jgi:glycyl-tRNA synthetase beta chain
MKPFLLEIGTEEIPARFIPGITDTFKEKFTSLLNESFIGFDNVTLYATPRRLALLADNVSEAQKAGSEEILGPPKKAAYDKSGKPTAAAAGFAKSQGVDVASLKVVNTDRGEYVAAFSEEKNRATQEVLSESLPGLITSLPFPKSMRWGNTSIRFVRPIRWITAIFGDTKVCFEIDGIKSGDMTCGHRFLSPGAFKIHDPSTYDHILLNNYVVADPVRRKKTISEEFRKMEARHGFRIHEDPDLLNEVTHLVEYPTVVYGSFSNQYLSLPRELLVTVMKNHQKFFSVEDEKGNLLPGFVLISNTMAENNDTVRRGAERVLKARLEDARFYCLEDQKIPLRDFIPQLRNVTFQEKLGSLHDKAERISSIASFLADALNLPFKEKLRKAAMLSKADLVTGIVREFPELQGYMGMIYAGASGEDSDVAAAVYEHYMPRSSGDMLPSGQIATILSVADKIDNIVSFFLLGLVPSGSEDPYGLRRQALGILKILQDTDHKIPLGLLVDRVVQEVKKYVPPRETLRNEVLAFFFQRLEGMLLQEGYSYDLVNAVLPDPESDAEKQDVKAIRKSLQALSALRKDPRFPDLLLSAKRVYNILSKYGPEDIRENLLTEHAEKDLYHTVERIRNMLRETDFKSLFELTKPVNTFFEAVLVMDKDQDKRKNRIALLSSVKALFDELGDFSKIVEQ